MQTRSVREVSENLSELISEVEKGQIFIITREDRQVAELRPVIQDRMHDPIWRAAYERMIERLRNKQHYGTEVGEITEEDKYGDAPA